MRRVSIALTILATVLPMLALLAPSAFSAGAVSKSYGNLTLDSPWETTHWDDVWDLTQGDLTLSYTIDMTGLHQPGTWNTYSGSTSYTEVGLRGEGAGDFNPGPWDTYQGNCGGWMVSSSPAWLDSDGYTESGNPNPDSIQDLDDKHGLQASGNRDEGDYDVLSSNPDTVLSPVGGQDNYGIWFDRDGVDPWQATYWGSVDGATYNTKGIYHIIVTYHAIDDGLGVMFATVNGVQQGFYAAGWKNAEPENYPAGLSFKGDMKHMQVFAGLWAPDAAYGPIALSDITANGFLGVSDPLVPDFTWSPTQICKGETVQFTDATHGGMPPYTYAWDFDNDGVIDSTDQNPTHVFADKGTYTVKLTVTPYRCTPKSVTKELKVCSFEVSSISPSSVSPAAFLCCARINGCCFKQGATVRLEKGTTVIGPMFLVYVSGSEIDAIFNVCGASPGKYDVVVTNPDGSEARLVEGFEVTPACGAGGGSAVLTIGLAFGLLSFAGGGHLLRRKRRRS